MSIPQDGSTQSAPDSKIRERFFGTGERSTSRGGTSRQKSPARTCPDDPVQADSFTSYRLDQPVKLQVSDKGALAQKPVTVMTALQMTADRYHDNNAFAVKVDGKWQKTKLREMYRMVRSAAKGLLRLGLGRFRGVGIVGFNAPEWVISYLAAIFAGGVSVGMHYGYPVEALEKMALSAQCSIIVVDSAEDLAKILQIRPKLPDLQAIVVYGKEGFQKTHGVYSWTELLEMGDKASEDRLKESILSQAPNYCCTVAFTVGRAGHPKTVMLSHDNVIWAGKVYGKYQSFSSADGVHVSFLPLSQPIGQLMDIFIPILYATTVYYAPRSVFKQGLVELMREVRPTFFIATPYVYEKVVDRLNLSYATNPFKKVLFKFAIEVGRKAYENTKEGKPRPFGWWLANQLVYKTVRRKLGLERCVEVHSGANFLLPQTVEYFVRLNILVLNNYGGTELCGPHAVSLPERHHVGSCGVEMDGCRTKFIPIPQTTYKEMCVKGRHVFMGYLNEPKVTADAFDDDGWYKTEDIGSRDENGFLYIIGRKEELIRLTDGRTIAPIPIEAAVKNLLPFTGHCIAYGHERPFIIMLMTFDALVDAETNIPLDVLSKKAEMWLRRMKVPISSISQMASGPPKALSNAVQSVIDHVNTTVLDSSTAIHKWRFLPRDFSLPTGELLPTYRENRRFVHELYATMIGNVYAES